MQVESFSIPVFDSTDTTEAQARVRLAYLELSLRLDDAACLPHMDLAEVADLVARFPHLNLPS